LPHLGGPRGAQGRSEGISRAGLRRDGQAPRLVGFTGGVRLVLCFSTLASLAYDVAARCEDTPGFKDMNGLSCSSWQGLPESEGCFSEANLEFDYYTKEGLADVQKNCPVACGTCTPPPFVLIAPNTRVVLLQLEIKGAVGLTDVVMQGSIGDALGASEDNVTEFVFASTAVAGQFNVSARVVLEEGASLRLALKTATELTDVSKTTGVAFRAGLANRSFVAPAQFVASHRELPKLEKVTLLQESYNRTTIGVYRVSAPEQSWCSDDPTFRDEHTEGCEAWVGLDCTDESRWSSSERSYSADSLAHIRKWCGASCGLCQKPSPAPKEQLLASCEDDPRLTSFCTRWTNLNCEWAYQMGYPEHYQSLLLERCPKTCGMCMPAVEPPCEDAPGFLDEKNRSCIEWSAPACYYEQEGYSRQAVLDVQANCPKSCGLCGTSDAPGRRLQNATGARPLTQYSKCEDDPNYSYLKLFQCGDFTGKACTIGTLHLDQRWMTTPEGSGIGPRAVWSWHKPLWEACPLACGLCDPPGREQPEDLLIECEDDRHIQDWCEFRWKDQVCKDWPLTVTLALPDRESDIYNRTIMERCPYTCDLCTRPVCGPGTRRDKVAHTCVGCELGRYALANRSGPDAAECLAAMPGDYVAETNATSYSRCEPGFFSAMAGSSSCEACPPGKYTDQFSASECKECDVGWFQDNSGRSECKPCERGLYSNETGRDICTECPMDRTTHWLRATGMHQCGCPEGFYQALGRMNDLCTPCPEGMRCPGGHSMLNASIDLTGVLVEGYMSLPEDPWMVYSCWGLSNTCPGERRVIAFEHEYDRICAEGRIGVRCAGCPDKHWQKKYACVKCEDSAGDVAWKAGLFLLLQFWAVANAYRKEGKETTAAWMMLMSFVAFLQVLQSLSKIPVAWPNELQVFFQALNLFSIPGMFKVMEFRQECLFGTSTLAQVLRDSLMPLLPVLNFVILWAILKCRRRTLVWPYVFNVIASIMFGLFMSICTMAMQMFPAEKMPEPNGKWFLRDIPGTELYSEEWRTCLPIAVASVAVYCGGSFIYTTRGVLLAPKRVSEETSFADQYDFILGDMNPKAWWWILISMANMLVLALIQVLFANVFMQLYLSMLVLSITILLQIAARPNVHKSVNNVEITLAVTNLIFLVFATAFIKEEDLLKQDTHVHAVVMVGIIGCVLLLASISIFWWIQNALRRTSIGKAATEVYRSRDLMLLLALLPEGKFLSLASKMIETDRILLKRTTDMLVATFLHEQPGKNFFRHRVIPGRGFTIWTPRKTASATHESVRSKTAHNVLEDNRMLRLNVKRLYLDLTRSNFGAKEMETLVECDNHQVEVVPTGFLPRMLAAKDRMLATLGRFRVMIIAKRVASVFFGDKLAIKMSREQFVSHIKDRTRLGLPDLHIIFNLFDVSDTGLIPVVDFFDLIEAMAHEEPKTMSQIFPQMPEDQDGGDPEPEPEEEAGPDDNNIGNGDVVALQMSLGTLRAESAQASAPKDACGDESDQFKAGRRINEISEVSIDEIPEVSPTSDDGYAGSTEAEGNETPQETGPDKPRGRMATNATSAAVGVEVHGDRSTMAREVRV